MNSVNLKEHKNRLERLKALIADERKILRIAVCGSFNSGKTSLLNLLFGLNLPVKGVSTTGVITKIRLGNRFQAEYANGLLRTVSERELNDIIAVKKTSKGVVQSEVVTAWVGCRSELLPDGTLEFWDTPGLEDDNILDELTRTAVEQCDVVIFVMSAQRLLSLSDKYFLALKLKESVGNNIVAVINQIDLLTSQDEREVLDDARYMLADFGNRYCGVGPVFTSANPETLQIKDLKNRLMRIVKNKQRRSDCLTAARKAKIKNFSAEWLSILNEDLKATEAALNFGGKQAEELYHLERKHDLTKRNLSQDIDLYIRKFDDVSFWQKTLDQVKTEDEWEKNYIALSATALKSAMKKIFEDIGVVFHKYLNMIEYPSCNPFLWSKINIDDIWAKMDWGKNFDDAHFGGMLSGAITGAGLGSVIPLIGTGIGMVTGFAVGAYRDGSKNEEAQKYFQATCVNNTILAYQNFVADEAKNIVEAFKKNLFVMMDQDFTDRIKRELNSEVSARNIFWKNRLEFGKYINQINECLAQI